MPRLNLMVVMLRRNDSRRYGSKGVITTVAEIIAMEMMMLVRLIPHLITEIVMPVMTVTSR